MPQFTGSIDDIFKKADINKLMGPGDLLSIQAQLSDPQATTTDVNQLNEFMIIGANNNRTIMSVFDNKQTILKKGIYKWPWIGIAVLTQGEIPSNVTMQDGFNLLKTCMARKNEPIPEQITRASVYKSIEGSQIIYDYTLKYPSGGCQEALYNPRMGTCQSGMSVACHYEIMLNPKD